MLIPAEEEGACQLVRFDRGASPEILGSGSEKLWAHGFSSCGRYAYVTGESGISLWKLDALQDAMVLRGQEKRVTFVDVFADGTKALSASQDRTVRVWSLRQGRVEQTLNHPAAVYWAKYDAAEERVATAGGDSVVRIWHLQSGRLLVELEGHEDRVTVAEWCGSDRILTLSYDRTAKLWDSVTGEELLEFREHADRLIPRLRIIRDGSYAVTGSIDGTVRAWPLDPASVARDSSARGRSAAERERFGVGP